VASLGRLQPTNDANAGAVRIVDYDLDGIDALGRATSRRAPVAHKSAQFGTHVVVERLMKADPDAPALVLREAEAVVEAHRNVYARADQSPRPIRTAEGPLCVLPRTIIRVDRPRRVTPGDQCQIADTRRKTHVHPSFVGQQVVQSFPAW